MCTKAISKLAKGPAIKCVGNFSIILTTPFRKNFLTYTSSIFDDIFKVQLFWEGRKKIWSLPILLDVIYWVGIFFEFYLAFSENLNFTSPISIANVFYGQPQILLSKEIDVFRSERNELQNRDIKLQNFKPKNVIDDKSSKKFI